jgi:magnesium chelatase family protein
MIGGGSRLWSGEIARAHTGVLMLDELLEFAPRIQDFLREPVETGEIQISRAGKNRTIPAEFILIATTNLCPCGRFVPKKADDTCRCSRLARRRVLSRLSGPFADRFAIIAYTDQWNEGKKQTSVQAIIENVQSATEFRVQKRRQAEPNSRIGTTELRESLTAFQRQQILAPLVGQSLRREQAVLRVARTFADLRSSIGIGNEDLNKALQLCFHSHQLLDQWRE